MKTIIRNKILKLLNSVNTWRPNFSLLFKHARSWVLVIFIISLLFSNYLSNPAIISAATATWDFSDPSIYDNPSSKIAMTDNKATLSDPGAANGSSINLNPASGVKANGAAQFTVANKDYLTISNAAQTGLNVGGNDFSFSCWINVTDLSAIRGIFSKGILSDSNSGYGLRVRVDGSLMATMGDGVSRVFGYSDAGDITTGGWNNVTVVGSRASNMTIYVNGSASGTPADISARTGDINPSDSFFLGSYQGTAGNLFDGSIDSFGFWNKALSADEIASIYNSNNGLTYSGINGSLQTNLVSWWDLNEESGTRMDSKGTNHLTSSAVQLIAPPVYGTEKILNPGYETYSGSQDDSVTDSFGNWTNVLPDGTIEATSSAHGGTNAVKITGGPAIGTKIRSDNITVSAGVTYYLAFWSKGDGSNAGMYYIRDVSNNGIIKDYTSTGITGTTYALVSYSFTTPANCTSLYIMFTTGHGDAYAAYFDDVSLKQVTTAATLNGGFGTAGVAPQPFANWEKTETGASTVNDETVSPYSGSHAARLDVDASNNNVQVNQTILIAGKKYKVTAYAKTNAGTPSFQMGTPTTSQNFTLTTSYVQYTFYFTADLATFKFGRGSAASSSLYIDNLTLESIGPLNAAGIAGGTPSESNFAAQFNGSSNYLSKTSNTDLQFGNYDWEFGAWINPDQLKSGAASNQDIISKGSTEAYLYVSTTRFVFVVNGIPVVASSFGTPSVGRWHFVRCWFNSAAGSINISVNNSSTNTTGGVTPAPGASNLTIGTSIGNGSFSGRVDEFYKRNAISSADEITALYNNGEGVKYTNAPATMKADANLISWWDLDERSGTRSDSKGTNHLSDNGTVTQGQGVGYFDGAVGNWTDLSSENAYTQTTQANKPTYSSTSLNGHPGALFDGSNDSLVKSGDQIGTGDITVFAVIKPLSNGQNAVGRIIDNNNFAFGVSGFNNGIFVNLGSTARSANNSIVAGTSYVVVCTRSSAGVVNIYLNGALSGSADQASQVPGAGSSTYVGNVSGLTAAFDGYLGPILKYDSILGSVERNQVEQTLGAKYGISVATAAGTASSSIYPTLSTKNPKYYSTISSFTPTLDPASTGTLRYQLSNDNTTNSVASASWYWWNGSAWTAADKYDAYESNTAEDISAHISTFYTINSPGAVNALKWRSFFITDGIDNQVVTGISAECITDNNPPTNPSTWSANIGGTSITSGTWITTTGNPNIIFSGATDAIAGVAGYFVYFGTNGSADPVTLGTYQAHSGAIGADQYFNPDPVTTGDDGKDYYLRIITLDKANNVSAAETKFEFGYDSTIPTRPSFVAASPEGYTTTNSFSFSWPAGTDPAGANGASGIKWYEYKRATDLVWSHTADANTRSVASIEAYQEGANAFYVRTVDLAGNTSSNYQQVTYYWSGEAPPKPTSLTISPDPSDENDLTISWQKPTVEPGDPPIAGYWYSVNATPTVNNTTYVPSTADTVSIGPDAFATLQGLNTIYVLSQNDAGNKSFETEYVASQTFTCQTPAPPTPTSVSITDSSDKIFNRWMLSLQWQAGPLQNATTFDHYAIERSLNGTDFSNLATTESLAYIDASGLTNTQTYYYRVKAVDNAGSTSVASTIVSKTPAGKYSSPPTYLSAPAIAVKVTIADVSWTTDRSSSSFIRFGTAASNLNDSKGQVDALTNHSIELTGLKPATTYYYQVQSVDEDREYSLESAYSTTYSFTTQSAPAISGVTISNITLSSADVSWETTTIATSVINYGQTTGYGSSIDDASGTGSTTHKVKILGLNPSTVYHFQIIGQDSDSNRLTSDDYSFSTLDYPSIENFKVELVTDKPTPGIRATWETNVLTSTVLKYSANGITKESVSAKLEKEHQAEVYELTDDSTYSVLAQGRDSFGNLAATNEIQVKTPFDTRPPKVSNIVIETSNVGLGQKDKAQMAVSWKTDEATTSQVEYAEGVSGLEYTQKTQEDPTLTNSHLVIISDLTPGKPYHLRVISKDKGGNSTNSEDNTVVAGEVPKSTLQLIIKVLNNTFGWLARII